MNTSSRIFLVGSVALASLTAMGTVHAQERGRVISTTPVVQQVAVPRQVCTTEQVTTQGQTKSGAGALIGAIAGGAMGNAVGQGSGRAAATAIGLFSGAIVGDKIEGGQAVAQTQNVQRCTTQTFYENKPVAYNVVYEFNGKQYQVQMAQDPGPFVNLQVTPVGTASTQPQAAAPVYVQPVVETSTVYVQPSTVYVQPATVYVRPFPLIPGPFIGPGPFFGPGPGRVVRGPYL
jgi:uncharacterized protein YcfJ